MPTYTRSAFEGVGKKVVYQDNISICMYFSPFDSRHRILDVRHKQHGKTESHVKKMDIKRWGRWVSDC